MTAIVETERLVMRDWREDDLETLAEMGADEETSRYTGGVMTRGESWRRLVYFIGHKTLRGYAPMALVEKASGGCIGWCGPYAPIDFPDREIGYALISSARGKGYATEGALAALRYAYRDLKWLTAISFIDLANAPSIAVANRLGARLERAHTHRGREVGAFRHRPPAEVLNATIH